MMNDLFMALIKQLYDEEYIWKVINTILNVPFHLTTCV